MSCTFPACRCEIPATCKEIEVTASIDTNDREAIVNRARKLRAEIKQAFDDAAHWNRTHPAELPIDPDPDGQLRRIADGLDRMFKAEAAAVHVCQEHDVACRELPPIIRCDTCPMKERT